MSLMSSFVGQLGLRHQNQNARIPASLSPLQLCPIGHAGVLVSAQQSDFMAPLEICRWTLVSV